MKIYAGKVAKFFFVFLAHEVDPSACFPTCTTESFRSILRLYSSMKFGNDVENMSPQILTKLNFRFCAFSRVQKNRLVRNPGLIRRSSVSGLRTRKVSLLPKFPPPSLRYTHTWTVSAFAFVMYHYLNTTLPSLVGHLSTS